MRYLYAIPSMLIISTIAQAEMYMKVGPLDTYGDVKARFPGASIQRLYPAWAQKTDVMYQITGFGISGTLIVKFDDSRPGWKDLSEKAEDPGNKELYLNFSNQTDEEAITVSWVRWVPNSPIPIQRFVSKYGVPEKSGFADDDFQPYRHWTAKGVAAYLSDDEKLVLRVDFSFTIEEYRAAYLQKYKYIPPWLQQEPTSPAANKKKSK